MKKKKYNFIWPPISNTHEREREETLETFDRNKLIFFSDIHNTHLNSIKLFFIYSKNFQSPIERLRINDHYHIMQTIEFQNTK